MHEGNEVLVALLRKGHRSSRIAGAVVGEIDHHLVMPFWSM